MFLLKWIIRSKVWRMLADDLPHKLVQVAEIEIRAREFPFENLALDQPFKDPSYFVLLLRDLVPKLEIKNFLNSVLILFPVHIHIELGGLFSGNFYFFPD